MSDSLFPDVEAREASDGRDDAPARYETANRTQIELQPCDLEALLPPGHAARLVWRFVEGLDLSAFYAAIRAREGRAGRPPIDPKILIALWLYATMDGVGSARAVDRLCYAHDAYRWLRGGVSVNYHTLSDFRLAHQAALDDLLTQSIAVLLHRGIVTMARVAQDGTRVRGSAGAGSFRRGETLRECQRHARKQVERTQRQTDAAVSAQVEAAARRAATDRLARVEEALAQLPAVHAIKDQQPRKKRVTEARVSTTDPDARVMKMADGGYRPAYNVHLATDVDSRVIVGVRTLNSGADQSHLGSMLDAIAHRLGRLPAGAAPRWGLCHEGGDHGGRRPARHCLCPADAARGADAAGRTRRSTAIRPPSPHGACGWRRTRPRRSIKRAGPRRNGSMPTPAPIGRWTGCPCAGSPRCTRGPCGSPSPTTCCAPWGLCRI